MKCNHLGRTALVPLQTLKINMSTRRQVRTTTVVIFSVKSVFLNWFTSICEKINSNYCYLYIIILIIIVLLHIIDFSQWTDIVDFSIIIFSPFSSFPTIILKQKLFNLLNFTRFIFKRLFFIFPHHKIGQVSFHLSFS